MKVEQNTNIENNSGRRKGRVWKQELAIINTKWKGTQWNRKNNITEYSKQLYENAFLTCYAMKLQN